MSKQNGLEMGTKLALDFLKLQKISQLNLRGNEVIPVVVQDAASKEVLMVAYTNQEALNFTLKNKVVAFWSTSRNKLWLKGKSSGCVLRMLEIRVNCEQNSLLYLVTRRANIGACHTGKSVILGFGPDSIISLSRFASGNGPGFKTRKEKSRANAGRN
jgi:phosphoribosyl-AMP cyclohydrolase